MKLDQLEKLGSVAIVGATGIVAKEFYEILSENKVKIPKLKLVPSSPTVNLISVSIFNFVLLNSLPTNFM